MMDEKNSSSKNVSVPRRLSARMLEEVALAWKKSSGSLPNFSQVTKSSSGTTASSFKNITPTVEHEELPLHAVQDEDIFEDLPVIPDHRMSTCSSVASESSARERGMIHSSEYVAQNGTMKNDAFLYLQRAKEKAHSRTMLSESKSRLGSSENIQKKYPSGLSNAKLGESTASLPTVPTSIRGPLHMNGSTNYLHTSARSSLSYASPPRMGKSRDNYSTSSSLPSIVDRKPIVRTSHLSSQSKKLKNSAHSRKGRKRWNGTICTIISLLIVAFIVSAGTFGNSLFRGGDVESLEVQGSGNVFVTTSPEATPSQFPSTRNDSGSTASNIPSLSSSVPSFRSKAPTFRPTASSTTLTTLPRNSTEPRLPSSEPSAAISYKPSSSSRSRQPSSEPSAAISYNPSSSSRSRQPSSEPSAAISYNPSSSSKPTEITVGPTATVSHHPTTHPSLSKLPTSGPSLSNKPTLSLSQNPTLFLSESPSVSQKPSISRGPSQRPSILPSVSLQPSTTRQPTTAPTRAPSPAPTTYSKKSKKRALNSNVRAYRIDERIIKIHNRKDDSD